MHARLVAFISLFCFAGITTVDAAEALRPRCGGVFELCGYLDAAGNEVIPRRFEKARPFQSGLAAVRLKGLWGFIEPSGEFAIEPRFRAVGDFHGARAEAALDDGAGVIGRDGKYVIPPRFDRAIPFTDDIALVSERSSLTSDRIARKVGRDLSFNPRRMFHRQRGWLTDAPQKFEWFRRPQEGASNLIWARSARLGSLYGLMDERGNWIVEPQFGLVQPLYEGRAIVRGPKRQDRWGAVDHSGRIVIPLTHHWLSSFTNGLAIIAGPGSFESRKKGLIRPDGTVIAEPVFDRVRRLKPGSLPRVQRGGIWYRVKNDGDLVPESEGTEADSSTIASCPQGLKVERHGAGYLLKDADGRLAFSEPASLVSFGIADDDGSISAGALESRELDCRAPIVVSMGDYRKGTSRSTYVRPDGRSLFNPPRFFPRAIRFHRGYAVVGTGGRRESGEWGIIDTDGRFTLPLGSEPISFVGRISKLAGAAIFSVGKGERSRLTDAQGRRLPDVEEMFDRFKRQQVLSCPDGARIVGDGERFGIAGPDGEILVAAVHRAISCFRNGLAWAPRDERGRWCPIGVDGAFRDAPACLEFFYSVRVSHHYPERFADDPYENSVLFQRALIRYGMNLRKDPPRWISRWPGRPYSVSPPRP